MVRINPAKKIDLHPIKAYLDGKADFDNNVFEAISEFDILPFMVDGSLTILSDFLDHLLRETPSKNLINLRRSYFSRTGASNDRTLLGFGVEAMRGVYQSMRMAEVRSSLSFISLLFLCQSY